MTAEEIVLHVEAVGGKLFLDGERLYYELPATAAPLLDNLRVQRNAVLALLQSRTFSPSIPEGIRLNKWEPKPPPVLLTRYSVVGDTYGFIETTLKELEGALLRPELPERMCVVRGLIEQLEQIGVHVELHQQDSRI